MPNRLAREKSPYLLQHAGNPVDWYPWGEEAFARARGEGKPIFLSIGYSTCHWCHVMEHESFENKEIAEILNRSFVSIKVDREERPDVDRVYMTYVQALSGHGGWPLNVWLTPELKPFFGGTYFPPEERHGRASFSHVLRAIATSWAEEREKLVAEGNRVIEVLSQQGRASAAELAGAESGSMDLTEPGAEAFEKCFQYFYEAFDPHSGGFGSAPKFPRASNLHFVFRAAAIQGLESEAGVEAVRMATTTLQKMAQGGIHDHVGGGFHRYSVDGEWFVPHFEKMLYDQAQIAINYLEARQATGHEVFAWVARDIFDYVERELTDGAGGFYSAEDADSLPPESANDPAARKTEGAFYLWTKAELDAVLGSDAELVATHFDVRPDGNVSSEQDPFGEFRGKNILRQRRSLVETARSLKLDVETANSRLVAALEKLREERARRPRPHLDDKIITGWNGLMISALARGAQVLAEETLARRATRAAEFIQRELYDDARGILFRSYREERSAVEGFADDYAFLIQGLLDLYEASFDIRWLQWAERLQQTMDRLFWDEANGGYFNSIAHDPSVVLRLKEGYDGAEPSPSSVAAMNLLRLAAIASNPDEVRARGLRTLAAFKGTWAQSPQAMPQMLCALEWALEPPRQIVIAGKPGTASFRSLSAVTAERLRRRYVILAADSGAGQQWLGARQSALREMSPNGAEASAYVCEHYECQRPVSDPAELRLALR